MPRVLFARHVVVHQQRLAAAVATELQLRVADVAVLQVVRKKVNVYLRTAFDAVDIHQVTRMTALRVYCCTHQTSACRPSGKSGGILPSVRAPITEGTAHWPTVLPFGSTR